MFQGLKNARKYFLNNVDGNAVVPWRGSFKAINNIDDISVCYRSQAHVVVVGGPEKFFKVTVHVRG